MTAQAQSLTQVSLIRRFIVTLIYLLSTMAILYGVVYLSSSSACANNGQCNKVDQIMYAIMGVADFIFAFVYVILGMKGMLPGAKKDKA